MKCLKLLSVLLGCSAPLAAMAQRTLDVPDCFYQDVTRAAVLRNAYHYQPSSFTPTPAGYEQFYIFFYGRHGSTPNPDPDATSAFISKLKTAYENGLLTPKGCQLYDDLVLVEKAAKGMNGYLSQAGVHQMEGIAQRMYVNFTDTFGGYSEVRCISSTNPASILSMTGMTNKLSACNPRMRIHISCDDCTNRKVSLQPMGSIQKDQIETSLAESRPYTLLDSIFIDFFIDSERAKEIFTGAESFSYALMEEASQSQNLDLKHPLNLFNYLPMDDIRHWWSRGNYKAYCEAGMSTEFKAVNRSRGAELLRNLVSSADNAMEKNVNGADLCFGDANGLIFLATNMDVDGLGKVLPLTETDHFRSFDVCPMAANLQLVFYRKNSAQTLVKVLLNERETTITSLEPVFDRYYKWSDVKNLLINSTTKDQK